MDYTEVYRSEYIQITQSGNDFFIESFKTGFRPEQLNKVIEGLPQIKITNFMAIKSILTSITSRTKFGISKPRITVNVSNDGLKAYITLCVNDAELVYNDRTPLINEIVKKLDEEKVTFGIKQDLFLSELPNHQQILIAEGEEPIKGENSVIRMYQLQDSQPKITEEGNADFYELSLINEVKAGDWLGERTDPTLGVNGTSVKGTPIIAKPGTKFPLLYDKRYVAEYRKDNITSLHAKISGAVNYREGRISISNYLEIPGNVDFGTGNIVFDGHVCIKETVMDGFSVIAEKDIEVLSNMGVGGATEIISNSGNVYIKGGASGNNRLTIKAKNNVYIKYVSDATIECEGTVNIGFYCLNSKITANEIIFDSPKSQIMGGELYAKTKIFSSIVGAPSEKPTIINIEGFDREDIKEDLDKLIKHIENTKSELMKLKNDVSLMACMNNLTEKQLRDYDRLIEKYYQTSEQVVKNETKRKQLANALRVKGEGELTANKVVYPGVKINIKGKSKSFVEPVKSVSIYFKDDELKVE
jgi:uncharacterized protein (DUF342 family)